MLPSHNTKFAPLPGHAATSPSLGAREMPSKTSPFVPGFQIFSFPFFASNLRLAEEHKEYCSDGS